MKLLKSWWKELDGNKVYVVAGATIAYALLGVFLGYLESQKAVDLILAALGAIGFRSAIQKLE